MIRMTITKLQQDPRGFWTANVTADGETVKVDNRIGLWSAPRDPRADNGARDVVRGEVVPEVAKRLRERVRAAEAGTPQDESDLAVTPVSPPAPRKTFRDVEPPKPAPRNGRSTAQRVAEAMARAGTQAINQEAA
jgi:hypothetical protein